MTDIPAGMVEWRDLAEAPPETPVLVQYHAWNEQGGELMEQVAWFHEGEWRCFPGTTGRAYADRWRPIPELSRTAPAVAPDEGGADEHTGCTDAELLDRLPTDDRLLELPSLLERLAKICSASRRCNTPEGPAVKAIVYAPMESAIDEAAWLALTFRQLRHRLAAPSAPISERERGLVELRELSDKATQGSWFAKEPGEDGSVWIDADEEGERPVAMIASGSPHSQDIHDGAFIVAAVAYVRAALESFDQGRG